MVAIARAAAPGLSVTWSIWFAAGGSFVLLANSAFAAKTVPELIAYAKANPGRINLGSSGTGNLSRSERRAVPDDDRDRGGPCAVSGHPAAHSALLAGDVHVLFDAVASSLPQIQSGALRALGVTASERQRVLPDIPPIGDSVPGFAVTGWLGIGALKGTPAEIVERLDQEVNLALADPAVKARMADLGSEPLFGSVSDFAKLIANETEKWARVVKFAGLKQD